MIKAFIVDDENHCIERLQQLLQENYSLSVSIAGMFDNVDDAYAAILKTYPDLVFLDVQIHEKTGFDLLRELGKVNFEVIFTTAYDKFAVQAFRCSALDYLLKPIEQSDLVQAMERFFLRKGPAAKDSRLHTLLSNTEQDSASPKRVMIPTVNGFEIYSVDEIIRCESSANYTTIYSAQHAKLLVAKTLKEFEEMLSGMGFYRIHNSHLVNLRFVKSYTKGKGGFITLSDGSTLEVSTRRKEEFLKALASK